MWCERCDREFPMDCQENGCGDALERMENLGKHPNWEFAKCVFCKMPVAICKNKCSTEVLSVN